MGKMISILLALILTVLSTKSYKISLIVNCVLTGLIALKSLKSEMIVLLDRLINLGGENKRYSQKYRSLDKLKNIIEFQADLAEKVNRECKYILPLIADYYKANKVMLITNKDNVITVTVYHKFSSKYEKKNLYKCYNITDIFTKQYIGIMELPIEIKSLIGKESKSIRINCNSNTKELKYAIITIYNKTINNRQIDDSIVNYALKVCVENSLMLESLVWENEHDRMTKLYNRDKYLSSLTGYNYYSNVGVMYFDINNLKITNDTKGHEIGDELIINTALSIINVVQDDNISTVDGYRIGGDEFVVIAYDITEQELYSLYGLWKQHIGYINQISRNVKCEVAVGMAYSSTNTDIQELIRQADENMYEDKKNYKKK